MSPLGRPRAALVLALAPGLGLACIVAGCSMPSLSAAPAGPPPVAATISAPAPPTVEHNARARGPLAVAAATHEYPGAPVRERVRAPAGDPVSAVRAFAGAYINWDAGSVAADMAGLAARSIGPARAAMALAAAQTASDYELARAGIANHGSVEAIAAVSGQAHRYAVVTLERTTATDSTAYAGLAAAWHVALATVTELPAGHWVVSAWQPEN